MAKCPECPALPNWIFTYGDTMTLLMIFFVLLLTFSQMDIVKFKEMAGSMKDAFGVQRLQVINPNPTGNTMIATNFTQEIIIVRLVEKLRLVLDQMINNGDAEIVETGEGFMIKIKNDPIFTPKTMQINPAYEATLQQIGSLLSNVPNLITVTAHTDNSPIDPIGPYPSAWAITAAQASSIVHFLASQGGVDPARLTARSQAATNPIASNNTEEGRAANRRIEITITRQTADTIPNNFSEPAAPPPSPQIRK